MEIRYLAVLGFGCSGNTAVADSLLESEIFDSFSDYEEIDDLRNSNGLVAIYEAYSENRFNSGFITHKIFMALLRFVRCIFWLFRHHFLSKPVGNYKNKFRNFLKTNRSNWLFVKTLFWFYRNKRKLNTTKIVRFYLESLKNECCLNEDQIFLVNNASFPEFLSNEVLLAFPDNLKMIFSIRDAYDSFCDIELNEAHFHPGSLGHEFILGRDKGGLLRRANFINVLKHRVEQVSLLIDLHPSRIFIVSFEKMVTDHFTIRGLMLNFCGVSESVFTSQQNLSRCRSFSPEKSARNIRSQSDKLNILKEYGYTSDMLSMLDGLNELYKQLESKSLRALGNIGDRPLV